MKSYLRFLRRNKLYTAIEVVGLSLALAFVIVLSSYIVNDMSVNKILKNTDDIYLVHKPEESTVYSEIPGLYENMPEILSSCSFVSSGKYKSLFDDITKASYGNNTADVASVCVSENFFDMFTFPLSQGDLSDVLEAKNSVVISENLANTLFPDGDALGKEINIFEKNSMKEYIPEVNDLDVNLTVTGVFKPFGRTIFIEPDIIIRFDLFSEQQYSMYQGSLEKGEFSFVKLAKEADPEKIASKLNAEFPKVARRYRREDFKMTVALTPFDKIKLQDPQKYGHAFKNIRHGKLYNIYLIMCIFLTIVALFEYIVLTIAFSRFRIKEIATRQLLGTDRMRVIGRCFMEAFILLIVSCIFAILLAVAFKNPVSQILGAEINPFSQLSEYLILAAIIIVMVSVASAVPSLILSSYTAINVIKGEARYRDKTVYGKVIIGVTGFLSIVALSICFGVSRQTKHLVNQPLGYNMDGIVCLEFEGEEASIIYDKLTTLTFIEKAGIYSLLPTGKIMTSVRDDAGKDERVYMLEGTEEFFDILGIRILEDYNVASVDKEDGKYYVCESSLSALAPYMQDGNIRKYHPTPLCGVISDFKLGTLKEESTGRITLANITTEDVILEWGGYLMAKVNIDEEEAKKRIEEFCIKNGYKDYMFNAYVMRDLVENNIKEEKNMIKLLTGFSFICILMTVLTIVGLSSYHNKTTEKDNAIRNVFGCSKKELIRKIILDFVLPVVISAAVAIPIAYTIIGRWLEGYVIRTHNSPAIYLGALAAVLLITTAAVTIQALRLMRTNPAEALKKE